MAVNDQGQVAGSVSGGCVEGDLYERLRGLLAAGAPARVSYGIADEQGFDIGLSCGGTIHLFLERLEGDAAWLRPYMEALAAGGGVALATVVEGAHAGTKLVVAADGQAGGSGDAALDGAIAAAALKAIADGRTDLVALDSPPDDAGTVFVETSVPPARLFVFGAVEFSRALSAAGKLMGYHIVVADARASFARPDRFPEADEVLRRWPHEVLEEAALTRRDAVCVLTHDPKFDVPALRAALRSPAGYVGALGSRRTQERRRAALLEIGLTSAEIDRIAAPIGLDIGAQTPAEFAVGVLAEIVAARAGRSGGPLSRSSGSIHGASQRPVSG